MTSNAKEILLLADHYLDPRLRNKIRIFKNSGYKLTIYEDRGRAPFLRPESSDKHIDQINDIDTSSIKRWSPKTNGIIYLSGVRIMFSLFMVLARFKKHHKLFIEVPDLPLRSHSSVINTMISLVFKITLKILADGLIITSNGFKPHMPALPTMLFENIMKVDMVERFLNNPRPIRAGTLTIGVVGALRYVHQLELIIRFVSDHPDKFSLNIHGGPEDDIKPLLSKYNAGNISYLGSFHYETDIFEIYSAIDLIYTSYDASQVNVQLALPNKLYEASLARVPLIVAKDTYLGEIVKKNSLGFEVPYRFSQYHEFECCMLDNSSRVKIFPENKYIKTIVTKSITNDAALIDFIENI